MRVFPAPISRVVSALAKLPGVGPKTALRYTYALLRLSDHERRMMAQAIDDLNHLNTCSQCYTYTEQETCEICLDEKRTKHQLCIVAESRDISTIEATNTYHGKYFVLGGQLNPIEGATPETLRVKLLVDKLETHPDIQEVLLAFSPDVHGETTIMYLARRIKQLDRTVTRLARGLPIGADIEYADEVTLGDAVLGRREV